jgi:hypothetical protein
MRCFTDEDVNTLTDLTNEKIQDARRSDDVTDEHLAHLYQLKGRLAKYAERGEEDEQPKKKTTRTRAPKNGDKPQAGESNTAPPQ